MVERQCSEDVVRGASRVIGVYHCSPCHNNATIERDGKWYCSKHDPVAVERRLIESVERSNIKRAWKRKMRAKFGK